MKSELRAGLVATLVLIGCRADVVVDDPAGVPGTGYPEGRQLWNPAFRVIGEDGVERDDYSVDIRNTEYYDEPESDQPDVRTDTRLVVSGGVVSREAEPVLPPLIVEVRTGDHAVAYLDLEPLEGDTIVVDLTQARHWVRFEVPPSFDDDPPFRLTVDVDLFTSIPSWPSGEVAAVTFDVVKPIRPGVNPIVIPDGVERLDNTDLEWSAERPSDADIDVLEFYFFDQTFAPGDTLVIDPALRYVWVDVRQRGVAAPSMLVEIAASILGGGPFGNGARSVVSLDGRPVRVPVQGEPFELQIEGQVERYFLSRPRPFAGVDDGDTLVVDLGAFEVDVRVEDAQGTPLRARRVVVASVTPVDRGVAELLTGADGHCQFVLDEDFHRFTVYGGTAQVDSTIFVEGDAAIVLVEPGGTP